MIDDLLTRAHGRRLAMEEHCKASAAQSVMSSPGAGSGWGAPRTGLARQELTHFSGWVHAAVRVIAQRIAAQPLCVGRRAAPRGGPGRRSLKAGNVPRVVKAVAEDVEAVEDHWLLQVVQRPNPYMVGWALLYCTVVNLELTGEAFWWLLPSGADDDQGSGMQLWLLPRSWVTPVDTDDALFVSYKVRPLNTGEEIEVPADQIVRFHLPDPANPLAGAVSPLLAQMRAVAADEQLQVAQHRAFENGINPGMAVTIGRHPDTAGVPGQRPILTREQRATLVAALKQAYRGVMNAGEPVILDGLVENVHKLTSTPQEMDFLNSGEATKARIFQGFGVNPISAGQVEGSNRASATIADEHLVVNTLNPIVEILSQTMTYDLAPKLGEPDLLIWLEPARARDPDAERLDWDQAIKAGSVTKNEVRARIGLEPLDGPEGEELVSAPSPLSPLGQEGTADRSGTFPVRQAV